MGTGGPRRPADDASAGVFTKRLADAPPAFFAVEAAGLAWLDEAAGAGGVPVVRPLEVHADRLVLPRLAGTPPPDRGGLSHGSRSLPSVRGATHARHLRAAAGEQVGTRFRGRSTTAVRERSRLR